MKRIKFFDEAKLVSNKSVYGVTEFFKNLSDEFKNPVSKKHLLKKTIALIESNPLNYDYCLEEFKKLPQVIEATKVGWIKTLTESTKNEKKATWFLSYLKIPDELKRDIRIVPILDQIKSSFVDFLGEHFHKMFPPKSQHPYLDEMRKQVEQLIEELQYEDFEISIYQEELEKIKASLEYQKATKDIAKEKASGEYLLKEGKHIDIEFVFDLGQNEKTYEIEVSNAIFTAELGEKYGAKLLNVGKDYVDIQLDPLAGENEGIVLKHLPKTEFKVVGQIGMDVPQSLETKNKLLASNIGKLFKIKFIKDFVATLYTKDQALKEFPEEKLGQKYHNFSAGNVFEDVYIFANIPDAVDVKVKFGDSIIYLPKEVFEVIDEESDPLVKIQFVKKGEYQAEYIDESGNPKLDTFSAMVGDIFEVKVVKETADTINFGYQDFVVKNVKKTDYKVVETAEHPPAKDNKAKLAGLITIKFNEEYPTTMLINTGNNPWEEQEIIFHKNETYTVNVVDDEGKTITVELAGGNLVHDLDKNIFEVVGESTTSPKVSPKVFPKIQKKNIDNSKDNLMSGILVKIKFNKDYSAILFPKEDATKPFATNHLHNYHTGEIVEVYVLKNYTKHISFQTQDNYLILNLPKEVFEIVGKATNSTTLPQPKGNVSTTNVGGFIKIRFNKEYPATTTKTINGTPHITSAVFHKDDTVKVSVIEDNGDSINVQFWDGSVLENLNKNDFTNLGAVI